MRAASLLIAVISTGCRLDAAPAPDPSQASALEVIGDGPVDHPRRGSCDHAWLIALEALNEPPTIASR